MKMEWCLELLEILGYGKILDMQQEKNFLSEENNYIGSILSLNAPSEVYAVGIRNTYGLDIDPSQELFGIQKMVIMTLMK